ncbi:MAG: Crp/Fnr family transcriptional regulator [Acidimicrobiia bacterium]|nr:Crp/Fnr family transcriptional regulator [Acidimicrobiia bacterium]
MDKAEFLHKTPLFSSCSSKTVESVAAVARVRTFNAGDVIIKKDSQSTVGFYVLLEGAVAVTDGERHLADLGAGEYFGEVALLLDDSPRTATVTATADAKVVAVTRWDFKALLKTNPEIAVEVMEALAQRLARTNEADTD